jgi:hypothetical protein
VCFRAGVTVAIGNTLTLLLIVVNIINAQLVQLAGIQRCLHCKLKASRSLSIPLREPSSPFKIIAANCHGIDQAS